MKASAAVACKITVSDVHAHKRVYVGDEITPQVLSWEPEPASYLFCFFVLLSREIGFRSASKIGASRSQIPVHLKTH